MMKRPGLRLLVSFSPLTTVLHCSDQDGFQLFSLLLRIQSSSAFPVQRVQVQSLLGDLRSLMLQGVAKKFLKKEEEEKNLTGPKLEDHKIHTIQNTLFL